MGTLPKAQSMLRVKIYIKDGVRFRTRFDRERKPRGEAEEGEWICKKIIPLALLKQFIVP